MFNQYLEGIKKLVIYGDGKKYMEKTRDLASVAEWKNGKVVDSYFDKILSINLTSEPKTARKENLSRKDNYYLTFKDDLFHERRTALYIHISEIDFEDLGEYIAMEHNGEKDYLYAYKVGFKHGATADIVHYERLNVSGDWTIPESEKAKGAKWGEYGRNVYYTRPTTTAKDGTVFNLVHRYFTTETISETYYTSEGYHKIEKDDSRKEREELAEVLSKALGKHISHYDIDSLLKVVSITIK